jgi:hypothetical protein
MKIVENSWDEIGASDCVFGNYIFENSTAKIYVHDGLDVGLEMQGQFRNMTNDGFAGHCVLVFLGVKKFDFRVREYKKQNDKIIWSDPITSRYEGQEKDELKTYYLAGSLYGFSTYVTVEIEAQKFELQILEENELS